jgi:L-methionine (R)-S-oxide reductase
MAESIHLPETKDRAMLYEALIPQWAALISGEKDLIAILANTAAALKETLGCVWIGFYLVKDGELVLGPFQGPIACTRIAFQRGVCGHAYTTQKTVIVPDVDAFPGHIACSSATRSEIVVPIFDPSGKGVGVLDLDSENLNDFSEVDQNYLEKMAARLSHSF